LIYLDSSALVKLAVTEPESAALADWLAASARLIRVSSPQAYTIVRRLREIRMTEAVLTRAAGVRPNVLRTLDAIHVASAMSVRDNLTALVSYDKRLLAAAQEAGLPTACPV
jgi:uncharacterized protein